MNKIEEGEAMMSIEPEHDEALAETMTIDLGRMDAVQEAAWIIRLTVPYFNRAAF